MPDQRIFDLVTQWLAQARPGVTMDTRITFDAIDNMLRLEAQRVAGESSGGDGGGDGDDRRRRLISGRGAEISKRYPFSVDPSIVATLAVSGGGFPTPGFPAGDAGAAPPAGGRVVVVPRAGGAIAAPRGTGVPVPPTFYPPAGIINVAPPGIGVVPIPPPVYHFPAGTIPGAPHPGTGTVAISSQAAGGGAVIVPAASYVNAIIVGSVSQTALSRSPTDQVQVRPPGWFDDYFRPTDPFFLSTEWAQENATWVGNNGQLSPLSDGTGIVWGLCRYRRFLYPTGAFIGAVIGGITVNTNHCFFVHATITHPTDVGVINSGYVMRIQQNLVTIYRFDAGVPTAIFTSVQHPVNGNTMGFHHRGANDVLAGGYQIYLNGDQVDGDTDVTYTSGYSGVGVWTVPDNEFFGAVHAHPILDPL